MAVCYELIFKGKIHPSINIETAKMRLSFVYNSDPAALDHLFTGEAFVLKTFHDEMEIEPYIEGLSKLGLIVEKNLFDPDAPAEIILAGPSLDHEVDFDAEMIGSEATLALSENSQIQSAQERLENEETPATPLSMSMIDEQLSAELSQKEAQVLGETSEPSFKYDLNNDSFIYSIIFSGKIDEEISRSTAMRSLQEFLQLTDQEIEPYFNGKTYTLIDNLSNEKAAAFVDYLMEKGLLVVISKRERPESIENTDELTPNTQADTEYEDLAQPTISQASKQADLEFSPSPLLFKIVFLGKCLEGFAKANVMPQMAETFNLQITQIEPLFNEQPHTIKSNLALADAEHLFKILNNLGLLVEIQTQ